MESMNINLPDHYYLSYEKSCIETKLKEVAIGKDSLGNVYYKEEKKEYLFMKYGKDYVLYRPDSYGIFKKVSSTLYSLKTIECMIEDFKNVVFMPLLNTISILNHKETRKIGGRECSIFSKGDTKESDVLIIDRKTGIFRDCINNQERLINKRFVLNELRFKDMFIVA